VDYRNKYEIFSKYEQQKHLFQIVSKTSMRYVQKRSASAQKCKWYFAFKFGILQVPENEVSLRELSDSTAQLPTLEETRDRGGGYWRCLSCVVFLMFIQVVNCLLVSMPITSTLSKSYSISLKTKVTDVGKS